MKEFSYSTYFNLCEELLSLKNESAFRTVINRSYLSTAMIVYGNIQKYIGKLPKSCCFYEELEEKVLRITGNRELMEDIKYLRYERVKADYSPKEKFSRSRAEDCLTLAKLITVR